MTLKQNLHEPLRKSPDHIPGIARLHRNVDMNSLSAGFFNAQRGIVFFSAVNFTAADANETGCVSVFLKVAAGFGRLLTPQYRERSVRRIRQHVRCHLLIIMNNLLLGNTRSLINDTIGPQYLTGIN